MKEEDILLIRQYVDGSLQTDALQAFEERLKNDPSLQEELALARQMEDHLANNAQKKATKAYLDQLHKKEFAKAAPAKSRRIFWLTATVAAASALLFGLWPSTSIYEQFVSHPELALNSKSSTETIDLATLDRAFNTQQYSKALPLLNGLLQQNSQDSQARFYRAICLLETDEYEAALTDFKTIEAGQSLFKADANWYLALTYLKMKDHKAAMQQLKKIPSSRKKLFDKAQQLLEALQ